jgi:hypothetical protein
MQTITIWNKNSENIMGTQAASEYKVIFVLIKIRSLVRGTSPPDR